MIVENIRDKKLLELYTTLTRSDLKGNINDTFVIRMLYTLLYVDALFKDESKENKIGLAKEVIRAYDEKLYDDSDYISIETICLGLQAYMDAEHKTYSDINKLNTRELKKIIVERCR